MPISQLFILALALVSARIAYGLYRKRVMWKWIVLYWCVLTAKNILDLLKCG